jgi:hypothetical protein
MLQLRESKMFGLPMRPLYVVVVALVLQSIAVFMGDGLRRRRREVEETERKDLATILPAALTLLTLLIGFSFSMAAGRYDQRKVLEEEEANAIGTEYARADLVPAQAAHIHALLSQYVDQRVLFYQVTDPAQHQAVAAATAALQAQLWDAVAAPAIATPTPVMALVVSGMNDVLNSQGYTQAMFWNRLPRVAWLLMLLVSVFCSFLFGYSEYRISRMRLWILPVIVALPLGLVADMDSPRYGLVHVVPQNLLALQATLH